MKKAIIGKKLGMTQIFLPDGRLVPVTVIQAGPCKVVQKKTVEKDGYEAVQFGFEEMNEKRAEKLLTQPVNGHFKKAGVAPQRHLREFRLDDSASYEVGQVIGADVFEAAPPRAADTPAPFTAGTSTPAPWPTVPSITAAWVP